MDLCHLVSEVREYRELELLDGLEVAQGFLGALLVAPVAESLRPQVLLQYFVHHAQENLACSDEPTFFVHEHCVSPNGRFVFGHQCFLNAHQYLQFD
jgi:hypothetical protein